jgi:selenocysteine-specific elongation factor
VRTAVVGTAGHVDHGKSALVRALTGIDPDRLEEEKRRGMTIDLGFAHMDLPSGVRVGFVDVPGHERLIHNMLAGAAGFDAVILVVAADEGVMPQTREHLAILRFLRIPKGVVVLTKRDLVDEAWLELVQEDVREFVRGTFLEGAPIVAVSSKTGEGLPELVRVLDRVVAEGSSRPADGPVRMPVDRSFHMSGFGTVVTGTLWSGRIRVEDELEILPQARAVRVRGIQSHGEPVQEVRAGQRVALNLLGVSKEEVRRGDVVASPGVLEVTKTLDVRLEILPGAPPLRHGEHIRVYLGTAEAPGRVALLEEAAIQPGSSGFAQIRLEEPIVALRTDPFVIRRFSPPVTWGGGEVLEVNPPRHRRADPAVRARLQTLEAKDPEAVLDLVLQRAGIQGATLLELVRRTGLRESVLREELARAEQAGRAFGVRDRWVHVQAVREVETQLADALSAYHRARPWRRGMPLGEWWTLVRRLAGPASELVRERLRDRILEEGGFVRLPEHRPRLTEEEAAARAQLRSWLERTGLEGPSRAEVASALGRPAEVAIQSLLDDGEVVELRGLLYSAKALERVERVVAEALRTRGELTVAALRDLLGTSRKYVLPLLEHFDTVGWTRRQGDVRVPGPRMPEG